MYATWFLHEYIYIYISTVTAVQALVKKSTERLYGPWISTTWQEHFKFFNNITLLSLVITDVSEDTFLWTSLAKCGKYLKYKNQALFMTWNLFLMTFVIYISKVVFLNFSFNKFAIYLTHCGLRARRARNLPDWIVLGLFNMSKLYLISPAH